MIVSKCKHADMEAVTWGVSPRGRWHGRDDRPFMHIKTVSVNVLRDQLLSTKVGYKTIRYVEHKWYQRTYQ